MAEAEPLLLRVDQAEPRYNEALQTAVAACAADTVGQTCYICYGEGDEDEGLVRRCSCRGENGFVHLSCLVRAAQVAVERGDGPGWMRWDTCGLCEQEYYGDVLCALGWACWKTYVGRPEADRPRQLAMTQLGIALSAAGHNEDALSVKETELSMLRRLGAPAEHILITLGNLSGTYARLGRDEQALSMYRDLYSGRLRFDGEEHKKTLLAASNYALSLGCLGHFEEARSLPRKTIPAARRVLGESHETTLGMRMVYANAISCDDGTTLDDLREAVTTLEETERSARRVFGGAHPITAGMGKALRKARAELRDREGAVESILEAMGAMTAGDA